MITHQHSKPILYHDGSVKRDELRKALLDAKQAYTERQTSLPGTAVVVQDGNCYHSAQSVQALLIVRLRGYNH